MDPARQPESDTHRLTATPCIVLVVDDDPIVLTVFRHQIRDALFDLRLCRSRAEAEAVLAGDNVDIAVVNYHLGAQQPSGVDVLAHVRRVRPDCFRILLTAETDMQIVADALNRGLCHALLTKPAVPDQVLALLRQGHGTAQLRRRNRALVAELSRRNQELESLHSQSERATEELRQAHERLREKQVELVRLETQGAVAQLGSGLSHELNNPLAAILGFAQRLQRRLKDDAETVRRLNVIVTEVERCRALVAQLRNLSAPLDESVCECAPATAFRAAAQRLVETGRSPPEMTVCGEIPPVLAAPRALIRVFEQIIDNAIGAGSQRCWLSGDRIGDRVRLSVENDGASPDDLALSNATKPFFTTWSAQGRRGLGLTIAAALLREQTGTLMLTRRSDAVGACCTIVLPLATPSQARLNAQADTSTDAVVLVVDDEPLIAELLHDCLVDSGCQAATVASCAEALGVLATRPVRAVLADVHLPDGSGVDLLRSAVARTPSLRGHVALVTGDNQSQQLERLAAETGFRVLAKPFRLEQVQTLIQQLL